AISEDNEELSSALFQFTTEKQKFYVWQDDYESYSPNTAPTGYVTTIPTNGDIAITDSNFASGSQSVAITDNNNASTVILLKSFNGASDIVVEADVYTSNWTEFQLRNGNSSLLRFLFKPDGVMNYID